MKDCNQCGKCCVNYSNGGLSASQAEIEAWEISRPDIHRYVRDGNIWVDPVTDRQLERCPWLTQVPGQQKFSCAIYVDRPEDCKLYPVSIQEMMNDECEMLEAKDIRNPKHAQKTLDRLMADSRPPLQ